MSVLARFLPTDGHTDVEHRRGRRNVRIEPMKRRHLRSIMPMEAAAYDTSWSRAVFESELDQVGDGSRFYIVARSGRELLGYAGIWIVRDPDGDQAHVTNIVVDERHRRKGVATRLMLALADEARSRGCVSWTLEVRQSAHGAQALYQRFGFAPVGVRKRYYNNVEDAVVMWCHELGTDEYTHRLEELACPSSNPNR